MNNERTVNPSVGWYDLFVWMKEMGIAPDDPTARAVQRVIDSNYPDDEISPLESTS